MAVAVLDLDFNDLPLELTGYNSYNSALVLIRMGVRPIGVRLSIHFLSLQLLEKCPLQLVGE